ncbi:MAG: 3'-5' exonuclease [Eubacteriales bacterium]|nr:3'-5' exonuclease [Eubacteriales bacterium]
MNYVVFDLEWNPCPAGKNRAVKTLPSEILEIGAVKLNSQFEEIDRFSEKIRPVVYPFFHYRTKELLHLNVEDFETARTFPEVCADFLEWAGKRVRFCTWGPADLCELQRNMRHYQMDYTFSYPLRYYDVQKLFALSFEDPKTRRSLEYAVDFLNLPKELDFHDAFYDSFYTAEILKRLDPDLVLSHYSIDYFRIPANRKEEISIRFDTYTKYVSKAFNSRLEAMHDRKVTSTTCYLCHRAAPKKIRWFLGGSRNYYCLAYCEEHGWLKGKIRLKKSEMNPDQVFCIKTLKLIDSIEAQAIADKKTSLREKGKHPEPEPLEEDD